MTHCLRWRLASDGTALRYRMKLFEDWLAEMGLSRLELRFRELDEGWELRLRW